MIIYPLVIMQFKRFEPKIYHLIHRIRSTTAHHTAPSNNYCLREIKSMIGAAACVWIHSHEDQRVYSKNHPPPKKNMDGVINDK